MENRVAVFVFFQRVNGEKNFPRQFPVEDSRYWGLVKIFKKFSPRQFPVEKKQKRCLCINVLHFQKQDALVPPPLKEVDLHLFAKKR